MAWRSAEGATIDSRAGREPKDAKKKGDRSTSVTTVPCSVHHQVQRRSMPRCLILSRRSSRRSRSAIFNTATSWRSSGAYINCRSPKVDLCALRSATFSQPAVKKLLSKAVSSGRGVAAAGVAHCRGASTASATSSEAAAAMLAMRRDVLGGPNGSLRCVLPRMGQPLGS